MRANDERVRCSRARGDGVTMPCVPRASEAARRSGNRSYRTGHLKFRAQLELANLQARYIPPDDFSLQFRPLGSAKLMN